MKVGVIEYICFITIVKFRNAAESVIRNESCSWFQTRVSNISAFNLRITPVSNSFGQPQRVIAFESPVQVSNLSVALQSQNHNQVSARAPHQQARSVSKSVSNISFLTVLGISNRYPTASASASQVRISERISVPLHIKDP